MSKWKKEALVPWEFSIYTLPINVKRKLGVRNTTLPNPMMGTGEDHYTRCVPWHHEFIDNVVHVCGAAPSYEVPSNYPEAYKIICDTVWQTLKKGARDTAASSWLVPHGNNLWGTHFKAYSFRCVKRATRMTTFHKKYGAVATTARKRRKKGKR